MEIKNTQDGEDNREVAVKGKDQREEVGHFQVAGVCLGEQRTGSAEAEDLAAELLERGAALVVHVGLGDEPANGAHFL